MPKPPNRNLAPESAQWGRWVEDNIAALESSDVQQTQGIQNGLKAVNGALGVLSEVVAHLNILSSTQTTVTNISISSAPQYLATTTIDVPPGSKSAIVIVNPSWKLNTSAALGTGPGINQTVEMITDLGVVGDVPSLVAGPPIIPPSASGVFFTGGASFVGVYGNTALVPARSLQLSWYVYTSGAYAVAANAANEVRLDATALFLNH